VHKLSGVTQLTEKVLSHALMTTEPVRIPLRFSAEQRFRSTNIETVADYSQTAIALCVDAVIFSHGDEDQRLQRHCALNRVESWQRLVQNFAQWYKHRPPDFQPVVELYPKDGMRSNDDFPMIVYTNGGALLANQLYHTGMLLLLQCKPRFAEKPSSSSTSMSALWHAHRICGIANQNDNPAYWDPSLVASLLVASRTVSHRSQHISILHTLENVKRLTGWKFVQLVDELMAEWQVAGAL
jgi:hypothetical protein